PKRRVGGYSTRTREGHSQRTGRESECVLKPAVFKEEAFWQMSAHCRHKHDRDKRGSGQRGQEASGQPQASTSLDEARHHSLQPRWSKTKLFHHLRGAGNAGAPKPSE